MNELVKKGLPFEILTNKEIPFQIMGKGKTPDVTNGFAEFIRYQLKTTIGKIIFDVYYDNTLYVHEINCCSEIKPLNEVLNFIDSCRSFLVQETKKIIDKKFFND